MSKVDSGSKQQWQQKLAFDRQHIWHPYTSMVDPLPCYPVESASGVEIKLASGEKLIDGMSSWWAAIHGYNHPKINAAIEKQLNKMSHVMFGGLTHQPAIDLAQKLIHLSPPGLQKIFFSDSGSVAVEVAIKMATQYWYSKGETKKTLLLTVRGGYHGDTSGCMSVCDPDAGMHEMFTAILPQQLFADKPACAFNENFEEAHIKNFKTIISENHQKLAAVIMEPIVQGAGGMYFYSPAYLKGVRELCDEFDVLLILDEIATGFGRSGKLFACEHANIEPDIMCIGKALTGGYMTLAATLCTEKVALGISRDGSGLLMHGPTFMANPLACACANASLDVLLENHWATQVKNIELLLKRELQSCIQYSYVKEVRVLGAMGVIELNQSVNMKKIQACFVSEGVWLRPFGKLVYMMPPYIISEAELKRLCAAVIKVLSKPENLF